ncbi:energy-coupling factor transporter transmembrane protein EcfT [bacterium]|nr:energy-coupling factor transporter transmembrane protein EcfT [bacterium]
MISSLKDITLGQYAYRNSVVHKLDPRTKLLSCMILMGTVLVVKSVFGLVIYTVFLFFLFFLSKLSFKVALYNIRSFVWLFSLTILFHLFFTKGEILFRIPLIDVNLYITGLYHGIFYALRITVLILAANLLTLTCSPMEITDGIEHFLRIFKKIGIKSHEFALMFSISLRFIPLLLEETDRIKKAQISRGSSFKGGMIKRVKQLIPLIIPLFLSAFRRSNDLALAMDARCYRGEGRTSYVFLNFSRNDFFAIIFAGLISFLTIYLS